MDPKAFTCRLAGCDGPCSGVCINNLSFDECPDVIPIPDDAQRALESAGKSPDDETVTIPGGRSLDAVACDALLRERGGTLIGIVAGPDVGKTTMIGTIYELIHRGRMPAFGFAGSETLRGYEERTHLARTTSNRHQPDTPRTPIEDQLSFTHLRLATVQGVMDAFFSDRSGEHFDRALDRPDRFSTFIELQRADIIVLMVDLARLKSTPHPVISWGRRMFMALEQHNLIDGKPFVLVGTKADLLMKENDQEDAITLLDALREDLCKRSRKGLQLRFFIIASRAPKGSKDVGQGLAELLTDILERPAAPCFHLGVSGIECPSELDALMRIPRKRPVG